MARPITSDGFAFNGGRDSSMKKSKSLSVKQMEKKYEMYLLLKNMKKNWLTFKSNSHDG